MAPPKEKEEDITSKESFSQSLSPLIFFPLVVHLNEDYEYLICILGLLYVKVNSDSLCTCVNSSRLVDNSLCKIHVKGFQKTPSNLTTITSTWAGVSISSATKLLCLLFINSCTSQIGSYFQQIHTHYIYTLYIQTVGLG